MTERQALTATRRLDSFRRGARFRLGHDPTRAGRVIDKTTGGIYVSLDHLLDRVFTTKNGASVRIRKSTEKVTISCATEVLPYR